VTAVLFLDIDGVLNSDRFRYAQPMGMREIDMLDPAAVATLNEITRRWDLGLVISSSWRAMPDLELILRGKGVEAEIVGSTPHAEGPRGFEIAEWLAQHPEVTRFVILDDDGDMGELSDHLVQTDHRYGLVQTDVERVAAVLSSRS
jgi:hypothetical protein